MAKPKVPPVWGTDAQGVSHSLGQLYPQGIPGAAPGFTGPTASIPSVAATLPAPNPGVFTAGKPSYDTTFTTGAAGLYGQYNRSKADLTQQQGYTQADLTEALQRLASKRPDDLQGIDENSNQQGLFFSGQNQKAHDKYETAYAQQAGDVNKQGQRALTGLATQQANLDPQFWEGMGGLFAGNAERAVAEGRGAFPDTVDPQFQTGDPNAYKLADYWVNYWANQPDSPDKQMALPKAVDSRAAAWITAMRAAGVPGY